MGVILDAPHLIANHREVEIENQDIVVLQTKASPCIFWGRRRDI